MFADQVVVELDRLVPGFVKWEVQTVDSNIFGTNCQSNTNLQRMVEWGILQDKQSKLNIEECSGDSHFKQALRKVWV
jgi:hypothetical protein